MTAKVTSQPVQIYHEEANYGGIRKDRVDALSLWGKDMTRDDDIANQFLVVVEGIKIAEKGYKPLLSRWQVAVKVADTIDGKVQYVILNRSSLIKRLNMDESELDFKISQGEVVEYIQDCLEDLRTNEKDIGRLLKKAVIDVDKENLPSLSDDDKAAIAKFLKVDISNGFGQAQFEQAIKNVWWKLSDKVDWPVKPEKTAIRCNIDLHPELKQSKEHQEIRYNPFPWDTSGKYDIKIMHDFVYIIEPKNLGKDEVAVELMGKDNGWFIISKDSLRKIGFQDSKNDFNPKILEIRLKNTITAINAVNEKMSEIKKGWKGADEDIVAVAKLFDNFADICNDKKALSVVKDFLDDYPYSAEKIIDLALKLEKLGVIQPELSPDIRHRSAYAFHDSPGKPQDRLNILAGREGIDIDDASGQFWVARDRKEITNNPAYCARSNQVAVNFGMTRGGYHYEIVNMESLLKRLEIKKEDFGKVRDEIKAAEKNGKAHEVIEKYLKQIAEKRKLIDEALRYIAQVEDFKIANVEDEVAITKFNMKDTALGRLYNARGKNGELPNLESILVNYVRTYFPELEGDVINLTNSTAREFLKNITPKLPWKVSKEGLTEEQAKKILPPSGF